jgi:glycosyltransferase involved in cell wall biosynthesis
MNGGVSIVICCYNSARRLPETLRRLAAQRVPEGVPWEVLVIDNASTDGTAEMALRLWPTLAPAPLRVVAEPNPGTANARYRSFFAARYEIVSFLDDDNAVAPDWVDKVAAFFRNHSEISAVGGPSKAIFEANPPTWFGHISMFLAIGDQNGQSGDITDRHGTLLWTAGMSVRKAPVLKLIKGGFRFFSCGGSSLRIQSGEDTELCFALRAAGGRLYYDAEMAIEHFMPADRLVWSNILKHMGIMGKSSPLLDLYLIALNRFPFQGMAAWKKTWLFQFLNTARKLGGLLLFHPWTCFLRPEGSVSALVFAKSAGRLATLWALRGRYQEIRDQIRYAPWAQGRY